MWIHVDCLHLYIHAVLCQRIYHEPFDYLRMFGICEASHKLTAPVRCISMALNLLRPTSDLVLCNIGTLAYRSFVDLLARFLS